MDFLTTQVLKRNFIEDLSLKTRIEDSLGKQIDTLYEIELLFEESRHRNHTE